MVKEEIKGILHNKLLIVVMIAIILIPSIYAGLFLSSMWDPYGDLEYLPVAVVNKDQSVTYNDKELHIGDELAEELRDNDSMAFNVVDEKTAFDGLENGTYYMVMTIPEDFSKCASTVMDDEPQKMVLEYATNPGKNYISMKLSESAVKQVKANIMEQVTKTYTEAVFESLDDVAEGFDTAVDGTVQMVDGEDKLLDGNKEITENLNKLAEGALDFKDGTSTLQSGLNEYLAGTDKINEGAKQLSEGAEKLNENVPTYTKGVATANKGSQKLVKSNKDLNDGVSKVSTGIKDLQTGVDDFETGLLGMQAQINGSLTTEKVAQIQLASQKLLELNTGIQDLNNAVNGEGNSIDGLTASLTGVGGNIQGAGADLTTIGGKLQSAGASAQNAGASAQAAGAKVTTAATNVGAVLAYINQAQTTTLTADQVSQLQVALLALTDPSGQSADNAAGYLGSVGSNISNIGADIQSAGASTAAAGEKLTAAGGTLTTLSNSDGLTTLKSSINTIATGSSQLLPQSSGALDSLLSGMQNVKHGLEKTADTDGETGLLEGISSIKKGVVKLDNGVSGKKGLQSGIKKYTTGVSSLNKGLTKITKNNKKLNSGVNTLSEGASELYNGTSTLVGNNDKLLDGAGKLNSGAITLADGASKLADGSGALGEGLVDLKDGTVTLQDGLSDGAEQVRENQVTDDNIEMFVAPVETDETMITKVENNGHAMAAYMLSVGLWVGCLAFCLMYPLVKANGKIKNGIAWWASKAVITYPVAWTMAFVVILVLNIALGFQPVDMFRTITVALMTATAFMSIMYYFNITFGKVGSFMMLIFMVLQLTGSAGTYPIEISGNLANSLHKWMPFTYTVDAFRSAIAGGGSIKREMLVLGMITIVFTVLSIGVFEIRGKKVAAEKKMIYDWIEEKGLA